MKHIPKHIPVLYILSLFILVGCTPNTITTMAEVPSTATNESLQVLFGDFSYSTRNEMTANGWIIRSGSGWPGVPGATFQPENLSFLDYPDQARKSSPAYDVVHRWHKREHLSDADLPPA